jgi:hypothetical protein
VWPDRHEAILGELGLTNEKQSTPKVDVAPGEACDFTNAQPEPESSANTVA